MIFSRLGGKPSIPAKASRMQESVPSWSQTDPSHDPRQTHSRFAARTEFGFVSGIPAVCAFVAATATFWRIPSSQVNTCKFISGRCNRNAYNQELSTNSSYFKSTNFSIVNKYIFSNTDISIKIFALLAIDSNKYS